MYNNISILHQMNPLNKIIMFLLFIIMLFNNNIYLLMILIILVIYMIIISKIPIKLFINIIINFKLLFIITISITIIFNYYLSLIILIKLLLSIIYLNIILNTTSKSSLLKGIENLLYPLSLLNINIYKISIYIISIIEQSNNIIKSQASRGLDYSTSNLIDKTKILLNIISLIKKKNKINDIMKVRLYNNMIKRSNYINNNFSIFDIKMIILHIGLLLVF